MSSSLAKETLMFDKNNFNNLARPFAVIFKTVFGLLDKLIRMLPITAKHAYRAVL